MKQSEKKTEAYLVKQIGFLPYALARKSQWIGRNGCPDRLVMTPALTVWVEVKSEGVKPEAHQLREHKRMIDAGQRVVVVDTKQAVDDLILQLKQANHAK